MRHSATAALSERKDVIVVASVSCIYGIGSPVDYETQVLSLRTGAIKARKDILRKLVDIQYKRNDTAFERSTFRVRGDVIDIYPAGSESAVRVELFDDEIESIKELNPLTGEITGIRSHVSIFVPEIASRQHIKNIATVLEESLEEAKITLDDVDYIAVTYAPGLIGALLVGVSFAKGLSYAKNIPIIPVHHIKGHMYANFLEHDIELPCISLVVSGGHTNIIYIDENHNFINIGETLDDAVGESCDKEIGRAHV